MKKHLSAIFAVLFAVCCLTLVACGGSKDAGSAPSADSKYIGTWKAVKAEAAGKEASMEEVLKGGSFILELKEDGSAVVTTDKTETGTWTEKSDGIHVAAGETNSDFKAQDDKLVLDVFIAKITFEKQ